MKTFAEQNPVVVGAVGVALTAAAVLAAMFYDKLPGLSTGREYSAYFAESGGMKAGAPVQVCGFRVGQVSAVELDGPRVLVTFDVEPGVRLGERTEAAIKTKTLLGAKILEISPRGDGQLSHPIALAQTTPPYQLSDALGELTTTISTMVASVKKVYTAINKPIPTQDALAAGKYNSGIMGSQGPRTKTMNNTQGVTTCRSCGRTISPSRCSYT